jgi:mRNA interferase MazF
MRRGEIWTVAGGPDYTGKPRPAVILQNDAFSGLDSVTFAGITTDRRGAAFRPPLRPSESNGLLAESWVMVDKITSVPRRKAGYLIGLLSDDEMASLEVAVILFLGLA